MSVVLLRRHLRCLAAAAVVMVTSPALLASTASASPPLEGAILVDQTTVASVPTSSSSPRIHIGLLLAGSVDASRATVQFSLQGATYAASVLFEQIAAAPVNGALSETPRLPLACAISSTRLANFTVALTTLGGPRPTGTMSENCTNPIPRLTLACFLTSCTGIYPLVITVRDGPGSVLSRFTTFVDVTAGHVTNPIRVALIAPLTNHGTTPLSSAAAVLAAAGRHQGVALTLAPVPALVDLSARRGGNIAELLRAASSSGRALIGDTYVPINPTWLSTSGLSAEIASQRDEGRSTLQGAGLSAPTTLTPSLQPGPLPTAADLRREGAGAVIVAGSSLTTDSATSIGWGQPFSLMSGSSAIRAVATDARITKLLANSAEDPVLTANQLLGFLAFRYREAPGLVTPRGAVVIPEAGTMLNPTLVDAVLRGLAITPELRAVTLPAFFGSVPVGGNGGPITRYASATTTASSPALASALGQTRLTWTGFQPPAVSSAVGCSWSRPSDPRG